MTPEEKNRFLAERLMGWTEHLTTELGNHPMAKAWDMKNGRLIAQDEWDPYHDITQALGIVVELTKQKFTFKLRTDIERPNSTFHFTASFHKGCKIWGSSAKTVEVIATAITDAAVEALKQ